MPNIISSLFPTQSMPDTIQISEVTVQLDSLHTAYSELLAEAKQSLEDFNFVPDPAQVKNIASEVSNIPNFRNRITSDVLAAIRRDLVSFKDMDNKDIPITYRTAIELLTERVTQNVEAAALERLSVTIDKCLNDPATQARIDAMFRIPPDMEEIKIKAELFDSMMKQMQATSDALAAITTKRSEDNKET